MAELASQRGISPRALRRHIRELETLGYLSTRRRPGQPSIYRLTTKGRGLTSVSGLLQRLFPRKRRGDRGIGGQGDKATVSPSPPHSVPVSGFTVGREDILTTLRDNVAKRRPTLLVGPLGIGKSHILRLLVADLEQKSRGAGGPGSTGAEDPGSGNPQSFAPNVSPQGHNRHAQDRPGRRSASARQDEVLHEIRNPKFLYLEHISPLKPALLELARLLHDSTDAPDTPRTNNSDTPDTGHDTPDIGTTNTRRQGEKRLESKE